MSVAFKVSAWNRHRKWDLFLREFAPDREVRILDVGFSEKEFSSTENYIEKHYPFPERLTALGVDVPIDIKRRYPKVQFVQYDGEKFPFGDNEFDICWSNAVLEHVGGRDEQVVFLKEIERVARSAFVTTPNRYFPIESHTRMPFLHFLPKKYFDRCLTLAGKEWASGDYMHLLSLHDLRKLLTRAGIAEYRLHRNRLAGVTLDFVVIFRSQSVRQRVMPDRSSTLPRCVGQALSFA